MPEARQTGRGGSRGSLLSLVGGTATGDSAQQRGPGGTEDEPLDGLLSTIETSVIPRLLMLHRGAGPIAAFADARAPLVPEEVRAFADLCAGGDLRTALDAVEQLAAAGLSLETILLDLLAEAARVLGEAWECDERSFTEVTVGLGVLQQITHALGPGFEGEVPTRGRVLLCAAPGEQHTLGLHLVGEFARRAGWAVEIDPLCDEQSLLDRLETEPVDLLGFTVSGDERLPRLEALIARLRARPRAPELAIMVGGPIDLAAFAERVRVTLCLTDAREAVDWLEERSVRLP